MEKIQGNCRKARECRKMAMLRDHDMTDFQYIDSVKDICGKCEDFEPYKEISPVSEYTEGVKKVVDGIDKIAATLSRGAKEAVEIIAELQRLKALGKGKDESQ